MRIFLVLVSLLLSAPAAAQTCTPTPFYVVGSGVTGGFLRGVFVPAGEIWKVEYGGLGYNGIQALSQVPDFSLEVEHFGDALYPVELSPVPFNKWGGTPVMALTRSILLPENTRLVARFNNLAASDATNIHLTYAGFKLPASQAACFFGGVGIVQGGSAQPQDFSALLAAAQAAATKLVDSAAALTELSHSAP